MNILAHLYLSFELPDVMAGNFLGDFIKGKKYQAFPQAIQDGILLHRHIDSQIDSHPQFKHSASLIKPEFGRYSGIIMDMFYDHLLVKHWDDFSGIAYDKYVDFAYETLEAYTPYYEGIAQQAFYYMHLQDWLRRYKTIEGIGKSLRGITHRAKFPKDLSLAIDLYPHVEPELYADFQICMQYMISSCQGWLKEHTDN